MKEEAAEDAAEAAAKLAELAKPAEPAEPAEEVKEPTEGWLWILFSAVEDYMKEVRRLRKKLRQIDELIAKKDAGASLE